VTSFTLGFRLFFNLLQINLLTRPPPSHFLGQGLSRGKKQKLDRDKTSTLRRPPVGLRRGESGRGLEEKSVFASARCHTMRTQRRRRRRELVSRRGSAGAAGNRRRTRDRRTKRSRTLER
jgi:hypothetical protein